MLAQIHVDESAVVVGCIFLLELLLYKDILTKYPERLVEKAVKGMLPKNARGRAILKKLHVYAGAEHNQAAQKPEPVNV